MSGRTLFCKSGMKKNIFIFYNDYLPLDCHKLNLAHFFCATNALFMTSTYQVFHVPKLLICNAMSSLADLVDEGRTSLSFLFSISCSFRQNYAKQECIPVGCVLPSSVAVSTMGVSASGYMGCLPHPFTTHPPSLSLHPLHHTSFEHHTPFHHTHPCEQNESQTGVKTLPPRNFVCGLEIIG